MRALVWMGASVLVACGGSNGSQNQYTVGASISGLSGSGLVLQLNMGSDLPVPASGVVTFGTSLSSGAPYNVSVKTQPLSPSQTCQVSNGTGTIAGANVTGVTVMCVTSTFGVSASISGLAGSGLVLQLNGQPVPIMGNGTVTLSTAINSGTGYAVAVSTQPTLPTQICMVANGTGTVGAANVTNVTVICTTSSVGTSGAAAMWLYFANGTEYGSLGGGNEGWLANLIGYPTNSSGSVSATTVISSLNLTDRYFCVATDSSGYLYVAVHAAFGSVSSGKVLVFGPTESGMATPARTIPIAGAPTGLALDGAGNIYVTISTFSTNGQVYSYSILEFAAGAGDNATPMRTLNIAAECLTPAVDADGNILCVPSGGVNGPSNQIQVFKSEQSGNTTPARTITLDSTVQIIDIGVDPSSNIFVLAAPVLGARVLEVPGGATGAGVATAVAGIPDGTLGTDFVAGNLRLDGAGSLYVFGLLGGAGPAAGQTLLRFAPGAAGFGAPVSETLVSPTFPTGFEDPVMAGFALH